LSIFKRTEAAPAPPKSLTFQKEPQTLYFCKDPAPPVVPPPAAPAPVATVLPPAPAPLPRPAPPASDFVPATPVPIAATPRPTPPAAGDLQLTAMQQPPMDLGGIGPAEPSSEEVVQLEPPGPQRLFRLESERALMERMRQRALQERGERIDFPEEPDVSKGERWQARAYPPTEVVEPNYVCYNRLYFEERNAERYGWDLGFVQPFVSAGYFFADLALLPYHMGTDPCRKFDCNTGYCLPGDPVPYVLYPPGLSVTGAVAEGATWVGIAALFP
jgi:hypothetical protein